MKRDIVELFLNSKLLDGFEIYKIIEDNKETANLSIKEVIKFHKNFLKNAKMHKDPVQTKTNYIKEIPEFTMTVIYIMKDDTEVTIIYSSNRNED